MTGARPASGQSCQIPTPAARTGPSVGVHAPAKRSFVVGSGPNGLAAAVVLARAGRGVTVFEAQDTFGGGMRSAALTLPGFVHDVCATAHPLALASPFFRSIPLGRCGLSFVQPPAPLAHPFDDGTAALLERSVVATGATLGEDATSYSRLMAPLVADWAKIVDDVLAPLRPPRHPVALTRFGWSAMRSATGLARREFRGEKARALFAGMAAHAMVPLDQPVTAAFGLVLAILGHAVGWPFARGGSQRIADALVEYLRVVGGDVALNAKVLALSDLADARDILLDLTPRQVLVVAGQRLPKRYRSQLGSYRYGPGAFKVDWALDAPIPWKAHECLRAGTVHLGGTLDEIAVSEKTVSLGGHSERPYVILAQASLFDDTRAPLGKHTAWAYCHVPNGSTFDMTERIEDQIERFAPGFRSRVLARQVMGPAALQEHNANYVGGDINGGIQDWRQLFTRPAARLDPYKIPIERVYLCSSSTPPGGGVHGMCGYFAAVDALRHAGP